MAPKSGKKASSGATKDGSATTVEKSARLQPNWPQFQHLPPASDLSIHDLVPSQIVTVSNFWPSKLCRDYVSFLSTLPLTTTPGKPKRGDAVRVNDRFQIDDPSFAERLWSATSLKDLVSSYDADLWGGEVVSYGELVEECQLLILIHPRRSA